MTRTWPPGQSFKRLRTKKKKKVDPGDESAVQDVGKTRAEIVAVGETGAEVVTVGETGTEAVIVGEAVAEAVAVSVAGPLPLPWT